MKAKEELRLHLQSQGVSERSIERVMKWMDAQKERYPWMVVYQ